MRLFPRSLGLLAALQLLPAGPVTAAAPTPELILTHGRIFTADPARPEAQALAVADGRVLAIGDDQTVAALAGPATRKIDLKGHRVIPGFNDAHYHLSVEPRGAVQVDLQSLDPGWPALRAALLREIKRTPTGTLIEADIGATVFNDRSVDRDALDALSTRHPLILSTLTGHAEIRNTPALALAGITEQIRDPLGGRYERDVRGRLTGVLREYAVIDADRAMADVTPDAEASRQLGRQLNEAARYGITSLQDMSNYLDPARASRLLAGIPTPIRVRVIRMPGTTPSGRNIAEGRGVAPHPTPLIIVNGTKWFADGVALESTMLPRGTHPDWRGANFDELVRELPPTFPDSELGAMLRESRSDHEPLMVHVSGYPAAAALLRAMESSGGPAAWADKRVRFEHGDGLFPDLIPRTKALGIVVVQNPLHFAVLGEDVLKLSQPVRTLLDAGVPVAFGSDGPPNPYLNLMLAITHPHQHSQGITREEALIAYTRTSAYAEFAEGDKGTLAPGKYADLVVLSQDLLTVPLAQLPATKSLLTLVGGRVVYDARQL
ncbi:MAG: amidohydrolase [Proteobacteria bacterium]|nr:amidohydrolase [Pseudomonadota bacterium]